MSICLPELLAPAGGMPQLETAIRFGADAVYVGMQRYGLRASASNFDREMLKKAVDHCHAAGKKIYVTFNIFAYDEDMDGLIDSAQYAQSIGVDAAIVADIGVISLLHEHVPGLAIHVSTQANTMNTRTALEYRRIGAERIVLSRELSFDHIEKMIRQLPEDLEIEAFVHGAVCMSHSGRCLLSSYMVSRAANRGACAQPCRWAYKFYEEKRPEGVMELEEDERGSYILSARDLCMIEHIPRLCQSGIKSLKIEGRMKTEYYVATVVGAYRRALDSYACDPEGYSSNTALLSELLTELNKASHRLSDTGFYFGHPEKPGDAGGFLQDAEYVARVQGVRDDKMYLEVKNRFFSDDKIEILTPGNIISFVPGAITIEESGEVVSFINRPKTIVTVKAVSGVSKGDMLRGPCRNHSRVQ